MKYNLNLITTAIAVFWMLFYSISSAYGQVNQTLIEGIEKQEQSRLEQTVNQTPIQELEEKLENNTSVIEQLDCLNPLEYSSAIQDECMDIMLNNNELMMNLSNEGVELE
jgi:ribosome assembly protein YihI (activator of Der GTPase)